MEAPTIEQKISMRSAAMLWCEFGLESVADLLNFAQQRSESDFDALLLSRDMSGRKTLNEIKDLLRKENPEIWVDEWETTFKTALSKFFRDRGMSDFDLIIKMLAEEVLRLRTAA